MLPLHQGFIISFGPRYMNSVVTCKCVRVVCYIEKKIKKMSTYMPKWTSLT
jgi:hypothetical protein